MRNRYTHGLEAFCPPKYNPNNLPHMYAFGGINEQGENVQYITRGIECPGDTMTLDEYDQVLRERNGRIGGVYEHLAPDYNLILFRFKLPDKTEHKKKAESFDLELWKSIMHNYEPEPTASHQEVKPGKEPKQEPDPKGFDLEW